MALVVCLSTIPFSSVTLAATDGDYEYRVLPDGTAEITQHTKRSGAIVIPGAMEVWEWKSGEGMVLVASYPVSSIGYGAFQNDFPTNITIPDSVTNIGDFAFCACDDLESVTIGDGVVRWGFV